MSHRPGEKTILMPVTASVGALPVPAFVRGNGIYEPISESGADAEGWSFRGMVRCRAGSAGGMDGLVAVANA